MIARVTLAALATAAVLGVAPAAAQADRSAEFVPFAGYMVFGDLLRGPLGTTLSNSNGTVIGAQIGVPVAGPVYVYASGAMARSDLTVGVPILGGLSVGSTDAWLFDGGLEFRLPRGSVSPIIQTGAGLVHYRIDNAIVDTRSTNPAIVVGAGVDLALAPAVGLRIMARDHVGRFDFQEAIVADVQGRTAHHLGFVAGLRFGF